MRAALPILDAPTADRVGSPSQRPRRPLDEIHSVDLTLRLPLRERHHRRDHQPERRLGPHAHRWVSPVQHVRAGQQHHQLQHLPQRRQAAVSQGQQDPAGHPGV